MNNNWPTNQIMNIKTKTIELAPSVTLDMVHMPGGRFMMGSPEDEVDRYNDESPQHEVTLAPFWMGKYPVTQAQYQAIMGDNPSGFKGDNCPVERVSCFDALEFCARLSAHTKQAYTLPSEAQWEYACRAGTTTPFHFGDTITPDLANYNGNQTTEVGNFLPNDFGLYDMHGNVWEWCLDHWHDDYNGVPADGSAWINADCLPEERISNVFLASWVDKNKFRILRGGSWYSYPSNCRCASRNAYYPVKRSSLLGFRVVSMYL